MLPANVKCVGQNKIDPRTENLNNVIAERGENIFELAVTDYESFNKPLFKPGFLGAKWPALDYYVELVGVRATTPFFFVQVKTTSGVLSSTSTGLSLAPAKDLFIRIKVEYPGTCSGSG